MRWASIPACLWLAACSGADPGNGVGSYMYIPGAQFIPGALDTQTSAGGATSPVVLPTSLNYSITPGTAGKTLAGTAGTDATAVLIGLVGDSGHWVVPVGSVDQSTGNLTFSTKASFAPTLPPPPVAIAFQAVARDGHGGPVQVQSFSLAATAPQGEMVVSLDWDTEADLDLRVTMPTVDGSTIEVGTRKRTSLVPPAPGDPEPSDEQVQAAAYLDMDSNAQCVIDGRRQENIVWPAAPVPGLYVVRVDTFSLCGETAAHWRLRLVRNGEEVNGSVVGGQSNDVDTRFAHGAGAGVQALVFQL